MTPTNNMILSFISDVRDFDLPYDLALDALHDAIDQDDASIMSSFIDRQLASR